MRHFSKTARMSATDIVLYVGAAVASVLNKLDGIFLLVTAKTSHQGENIIVG